MERKMKETATELTDCTVYIIHIKVANVVH